MKLKREELIKSGKSKRQAKNKKNIFQTAVKNPKNNIIIVRLNNIFILL
jgi:hypothetical protein